MRLTVCIPMYNESAIIAQTAQALSDYMTANFQDYEILFSDDGSRDGSAEIVKALGLPNIHVLENPVNQGKGAAIRAAMLEATGDYVMFTDADLAYGVEVIGRVAEAFRSNPEKKLVIGSRNMDKEGYAGYTAARRIASKVYIAVLCMVGGFRLSDSQCGCKAFTAEAAKEIFRRCEVNGFAFDFEALLWAEKLGMPILEMPVKIINHRASKINLLRDSVRMLRDLMRIRRHVNWAAKAENKNKSAKNEKN